MKKHLKYKFVIAFLLIINAFTISAQKADSLVINNLIVTYESEYPDSSGPQTVKLFIILKLNHPEDTKKLFLKLGSEQNDSKLLNDVIEIVKVDDYPSLKTGQGTYKLFGTMGMCFYKIERLDTRELLWATMHGEDRDGNLTKRVYCEIIK